MLVFHLTHYLVYIARFIVKSIMEPILNHHSVIIQIIPLGISSPYEIRGEKIRLIVSCVSVLAVILASTAKPSLTKADGELAATE